MDFDFNQLRRRPDVEAENLFAVDASDRLLLDEAAGALSAAAPGEVAVIDDRYGALTLGAAALFGVRELRVHQDPLSGERALAANAAATQFAGVYRSVDLGAELLGGARVVLMQLPRSLDALDELAAAVARHADPRVRLFAGGRLKHMTTSMNEVIGRHFLDLQVSHARQKSRVLIAASPISSVASWPRVEHDAELGLTVCAHGGVFAGAGVDIGSRFLLEHLDEMKPDARTAIDLACGTGVLATALAIRRPALAVTAADQSAAAVASTRATAAANGVADRVSVIRDDALGSLPPASAELIMLNPPFHIGSSVHAGIALKLFADAARVLRPGGELWTVWNSHLGYRPALARIVGPTRQAGRNAKFTVTASIRGQGGPGPAAG